MSDLLRKKSKSSSTEHKLSEELEQFVRGRNLEKVMDKATAPLLDDSKIKRVEIIVLKYKSPEMEKECVDRIIEHTQWPYRLTVFDNRGNGPNTAKAWNKLIKESPCDYVLFIDSDAFVHSVPDAIYQGEKKVCWVTEMMKPFKWWKDVAWVGPVSGSHSTSTMQSMNPRNLDPHPVDGHLSGYCFLTKKSIYDETGYFDEDFNFYGQESDWLEKVFEKNKHKVVLAPRAHVHHGEGDVGSLAAKQAQKESEMDIEEESSYSYYMWNLKKQQRMSAKGEKYEFKI